MFDDRLDKICILFLFSSTDWFIQKYKNPSTFFKI
jgi:hypothetical protein